MTRPYPPDWLDDLGAAYLLCLPVSTFREYVAAGVLPEGVKIGKHRRWARDRLNATLATLADPAKDDGPGAALRGIAHGQKEKGRRHAA
ncbi:MAG: hypothetical protein H0X01_00590 [Nitrospira sp.]|nr:hypothetical protein [Nitrospira sp.]